MRRNSSHNKTPLLKLPPGSHVTYALARASSLHTQGGATRRHVCAIHRFPWRKVTTRTSTQTYTRARAQKDPRSFTDTVVEYNALCTSTLLLAFLRAHARIITPGSDNNASWKWRRVWKGCASLSHLARTLACGARRGWVPSRRSNYHVARGNETVRDSIDWSWKRLEPSELLTRYLEVTKLINDNN